VPIESSPVINEKSLNSDEYKKISENHERPKRQAAYQAEGRIQQILSRECHE
jgi:hypothetical protein